MPEAPLQKKDMFTVATISASACSLAFAGGILGFLIGCSWIAPLHEAHHDQARGGGRAARIKTAMHASPIAESRRRWLRSSSSQSAFAEQEPSQMEDMLRQNLILPCGSEPLRKEAMDSVHALGPAA